METLDYPKSSNTLSIAGLALSVMAFVIALIPCFGMIAFVPALLGLVFALIGLAQNEKHRTPKSIAIVGIVMSTTTLLIAGAWTGIISSLSSHADERIEKHVEHIIEDIKEDIKDANIHIQIEEHSLSEEEIDQIREEAEKAGEVAQEIVTKLLKGIKSIDIKSNNKSITIKVPREELSSEEIEELEHELEKLEEDMQQIVDDFSITLELKKNEEK
ncbi:EI24 domain-containing protein [Carboxylicivirga linearis]|uniref:EI24 domain-containing protein n=1 Tax=Carboxylicivirga linearis TaxID=1628157 RepID=A0ABS5JQA1_9BACT|nr:EI24 domain-containing protein [Carboxylicivirga linearis]MBS2096983.1 EI24 domain-containing protein [Carboxylicivirga linearis]